MMYDLIIYNHGTCKTKNRICNNIEEVMENCPVKLYPVDGGYMGHDEDTDYMAIELDYGRYI